MEKIGTFRKWGSRLIRFFGAIYAFVGVSLRVEIVSGRHWVGLLSLGMSLLILGAVTIAVQCRLEELSYEQLLYGFLLLLIPQVMLGAAMRKDWGNFLIYYSLMLGILHGIDRMDCEPLRMFVPKSAIPVRVVKGMAGFKKQSVDFFDGYGATQFA